MFEKFTSLVSFLNDEKISMTTLENEFLKRFFEEPVLYIKKIENWPLWEGKFFP
jgi:hypothetical protein